MLVSYYLLQESNIFESGEYSSLDYIYRVATAQGKQGKWIGLSSQFCVCNSHKLCKLEQGKFVVRQGKHREFENTIEWVPLLIVHTCSIKTVISN